jgi:peptide/nickel transport system permease protein
MKVRFRAADGSFSLRPFVYQTKRTRDENFQNVDLPIASEPRPLKFFTQGDPYRLFGLIPTRTHLFGVDNGYVFVLGTDQQGRDYFSRLLYGSQISLSVGLLAIAITFTLGMLVGGASGFYGGRVDDLIMRGCEVLMSVPDFYLLLALAAALPADMNPIVVYVLIIAILSFVGWAGMARIIRGMTLSVREREYVEAARSMGQSDLQIIVRHILPSTFTYAIVAATMSVPGYILGEAGLSFLGLGIRDPMASWGNMLSAAQDLTTLEERQWILAPGFVIALTTLAFNFLGDGLRDALDPKTRK